MQQVFTRSKARALSASISRSNSQQDNFGNRSELKQLKRVDSNSSFRKRSSNNYDAHERVVRFKSTADEFEFDSDAYDQSGLTNASDVFKKILKDMRYGVSAEDEDDEVFDGVFTATAVGDRFERKTEGKKTMMPRKSILKKERRVSSARR